VTNIPPVADLNGPATGIDFGPATFVEGGAPVAIVDPAQLTVTDTDHATIAKATITVTNAIDGASESLALTCPDVAPGCSGAIQRADVVSALVAGSPATLTLTITRVAPLADYQALLRTLTYANASTNPDTTDRDITVTLNDGIADAAPPSHAVVVLNGVNDPPTITAPAAVTTRVDTPYAFASTVSVADPDAGTATVNLTLTATNGTVGISGAAGLTITGNGTSSVTAAGPISSLNSALLGLAFTPASGYSGSASLAIGVNDNGNTGSGGPKTASRTVAITVNQPPSITSANATTFTVGQAGSFTITTSAAPAANTITFTGTLPSGVTFVNNGTGTATLAGTPAAASGGTFALTITASNGVSPDATQAFTLTVNQAPAITSGNSATFSVGSAGSFTATASGFPAPTFALTGALPTGVTFNASTGVLAGTPAAGTGGTYPVTITASNGVGTNATQAFTLTVNQAPAITSVSSALFTVGAAGSFTVTTSGTPAVTAVSLTGSLPTGLTAVNAGSTLTISGTPASGTGGTYPVTLTAVNGITPNATQTLTITVQQAPTITSANSTRFQVGSAGTFSVSTQGFPAPSLAEGGTLPSGVTFVDNGNGTATLAGTPAAGANASSPYALTFTATNAVGSASQPFTLQVCPVLSATPSSLPQATRTNAYSTPIAGSGGTAPYSFAVTGGSLPAGLALAANGTLSGTPTASGTFTFTASVTDNLGCTGSASFTLTVLNPPVAGTDSYETVGNTLLEVAATSTAAAPKVYVSGNVLANDNDGQGGANGANVSVASTGTFATTSGGSITLAANGAFTYVPAAGFTGTDSSSYTVTNTVGGSATGTINVNVLATRVWYVKNNAASGNGTSTSPFNALASAAGASAIGDTIFVFAGDGTTAGQSSGITLKNNQRLIGEGVLLSAGTTVNGVTNPTLYPAGSTPQVANTAGNGVILASNNTVSGVKIASTSGTALIGTNVGTLTVAATDIVTTGQAIDLTGVGAPAVSVAFGTVSSSGGARNVNLVGLGGTVDLGTGALSGATGNALDVSGGTANVSYAGTIAASATNARAVSVASETGGTVALSGKVSSSASSAGVVLTSNTGATINFTGGLSLATIGNAAFTATGGGTVTATQDNSTIVNTLSATSAAALTVQNTTIGAAGLTFRSVASSGGTGDGIILDTTGTGGLTVTGDGTNVALGGNGTGGTISNKGGSDLTNTQGAGIYLNNASNVVLRRMTINGTNGNYGIHGYNVNGFTLEYSTVSGTMGNTASFASPESYGEGAIYFGNATTNGIASSGTFTANSISGGRSRNLSIVNTAGTATLTIKSNTFGQVQNFSDANQNLAIEARGSAVVNATLGGAVAGNGNTLTGSPGDQVNLTGQSGTSFTVSMIGNTLTNTHPQNVIGGGGLTLASQGSMSFTVQNNNIYGADGSAVTLQLGSTGTLLSGKVDGNTIGQSGVAGSGSKSGNGIFGSYAGTGTASVTITNNTIQQYLGNAGLYFDNTGGSYTANFTIRNNIVTQPGPNAFAGLALTNGAPSSTDTVHVCADIKSNDFSAGDPFNVNDVLVGASGSSSGHSFVLPGYVGSTLAAVQTFIQNNNSLPASTTVMAYTDAPVTAAAFVGTGTSCPTPP
jgi:hypothetical protein